MSNHKVEATKPRIAFPVPTSADFEYNHACVPQYAFAVQRSGGALIELTLDASQNDLRRVIESCHGVLLPGSPSDVNPHRYGQGRDPHSSAADERREAIDQLLLERAERLKQPVLGVCYGLQSMNVWRGGTLLQDLAVLPVNHSAGPSVAAAHSAAVAAPGKLCELVCNEQVSGMAQQGRLLVNSSHHQAVGITGEGLRVAARCPQDGVVEALESEDGLMLGVQWHPERSYELSGTSRNLFGWLMLEARRRMER